MIHGPTGRSRPGPGLKVDPWGGVRLDSDGRPETFDPEFHWRAGSRSREARRWPTGKVFCEGYDHGEAHPGDPRGLVLVPAVVELLVVGRDPGHEDWQVFRRLYCLPCARWDLKDDATLRRSSGSGLVAGWRQRRSRLTWLTTLVNGEVPT
jgi:hypothetical protein